MNHMVDAQGQRESWRYHFMVHQFVSNTATALGATEARKDAGAGSGVMDAVKREQSGEGVSGPLEGLRVLDLGTRIAAPFCAGLLGEQGAEVIKIEQPDRRRLHARDRPVRTRSRRADGRGTRCSGPSKAAAARASPSTCAPPRVRTCSGASPRQADVVIENFRPGTLEQWNIAPGDLDPRLVVVRISSFGQDGPNSPRPGLDRVGIGFGGLLHLTGYPDRPPVRVGVTISDYLTGIFAAHAATAALYARRRRDAQGGGGGAVIDAALYGAVLRILEWTLPAYDRLGIVRYREGNRLANSAPLDNYPTADGKYVCIVAGSDANFSRLCKAMDRVDLVGGPTLHDGSPNAPRAATRSTASSPSGRAACPRARSRRAASSTTSPWRRPTPPPTSSPTRTSRPGATS